MRLKNHPVSGVTSLETVGRTLQQNPALDDEKVHENEKKSSISRQSGADCSSPWLGHWMCALP